MLGPGLKKEKPLSSEFAFSLAAAFLKQSLHYLPWQLAACNTLTGIRNGRRPRGVREASGGRGAIVPLRGPYESPRPNPRVQANDGANPYGGVRPLTVPHIQ